MRMTRNNRNKIMISIFNNRILISFIVSMISLMMIFLQINNVNIDNIISYFFSLFIILFIPSYPLFFIILRRMKINFIERLIFTIILNLSFYILIGYFGSLADFLINAYYFYFITLITYLITFLYSIIELNKSGNQGFLIFEKNSKNYTEFCNNFSLLNFLKQKLSLNIFLLIVFLILICLFNIFSVSLFLGTDSWLHISIIKYIVEINVVPSHEYFGAMGLHIFSSAFHFFSGMDIILIPKFYVFYTFPTSAMILYIIFKRIFKNRNLAIFGVFILSFSSLGFGGIMHLFWPESLAYLQGLMIFFILYLRISEYVELKTIQKHHFLTNMIISYTLIILLFLSALLTHSLVTMILLISFLWIFLIYFLKDYRRGIDFIILCILMGIFFIFYLLDIGTSHFIVFSGLGQLPIFYYFLLVLGLLVIFIPIIRKFVKAIKFGQNDFFKIDSHEFKKHQNIESKIIIPSAIIIVSLLTTIFMIGNIFTLNLDIISAITSTEMFLYAFFAGWGLIMFQKTSKGEILYIWAIGFGLLILFALIYDMIFIVKGFWLRIIHISSPCIIIGFISYIYKLIKIRAIEYKKFTFILSFIIIFSLIASFSYNNVTFRNFSLERRELSMIQGYSKYTSNKNVIITEFGWHYPIMYYSYPFDEDNILLELDSSFYFIKVNNSLLKPDEHISDNVNILQKLKNDYNTEVYIFFTDYFLVYGGWTFYSGLNSTEVHQYYELPYLNKVFSSKSTTGIIEPIYWVI